MKTNLKQNFTVSLLRCHLLQGSPTPRPRTTTGLWPVRNPAAQQEVSRGRVSEASSAASMPLHRSHSRLNHPRPPPPLSVEELSSTEPVPGAEKVGDCWLTKWILGFLKKPSVAKYSFNTSNRVWGVSRGRWSLEVYRNC